MSIYGGLESQTLNFHHQVAVEHSILLYQMIEVKDLTYVFPDQTVGIHPTSFLLPSQSRTVLIGANGAGKSTLLKVLAGKTLAKAGSVLINEKDPFREGVPGITYLGTEWATNPIVRHDISVVLLLSSIGGDLYSERRDELVNILDIDLTWHMHAVSDGERRRVQLAMGLLKPWNILLLDEVTVDLDVLVRARLLNFLKYETEIRPCQIVYATHIFDGLSNWPTHIAHLHLGRMVSVESFEDAVKGKTAERSPLFNGNSPLLELALKWLVDDLEARGERGEKLKWDDIKGQVLEGALEKNQENGFDKYFKQSRARD
jgi:CCR4-NOT complex subunit CAF16